MAKNNIVRTVFDANNFDELNTYISTGAQGTLTKEQTEYFELLSEINGISRKGSSNAINYLKNVKGLSDFVARQVFWDSCNLFYKDIKIEKKSLRNLLLEKLMFTLDYLIETVKDEKGADVIKNTIIQIAELAGLNKEEPPVIPPELYAKYIKYYSLSSEDINLPSIDRKMLAAKIDAIEEISEKEKLRLKRDATTIDVDFEDFIDDVKEKAEEK
jgi:hypothetical protein